VPVLLIVPDAEALTATTRGIDIAEAPGASGPGLVQVTTWDTAPQVQPEAVADTNVKFASSVSDTVIEPVVGPLPTLLTARVNTLLFPAPKLPLLCDVTMARSGARLIVVESLAEAELDIPPPDTLTWFTCGEVALAATFTVTVTAG
jgi:hypothetical protein